MSGAGPTGTCCDNCENGTHNIVPAVLTHTVTVRTSGPRPAVGPVWRSAVPAKRADGYLEDALVFLRDWRSRTWEARYSSQPYGPPGILPESTLKSLALWTTYHSVDDIHPLRWQYTLRHGQEVLDGLHAIDRKRALDVLAAEAEQREAEEAERECRKKEREMAKQQERDAREIARQLAVEKKRLEKEEKVAENARKKAEKAAEKARKKAEIIARKQAEKEEKDRQRASQAADGPPRRRTSQKRKAEGDEDAAKENEAPTGDQHVPKRPRLSATDCANSYAAYPPTPVTARRPQPKPRPIRPAPSHIPVTDTSSVSTFPMIATPATTGTIIPVHASSPSMPSECCFYSWGYPTPSTPTPGSLSGRFSAFHGESPISPIPLHIAPSPTLPYAMPFISHPTESQGKPC